MLPFILAHRLHNQRLSQSAFRQPGEVVAWLGALQGQDYAGVKWSVGLRLPGSTEADIERAIVDGQLVRTWVMRGTLHLVAAADVRWLVGLVGARVIASLAGRHRQLELDAQTFAQARDVLTAALAGGRALRRDALFAALAAAGIAPTGQRGYHILSTLSLQGLLVQGDAERSNPSFRLLAEAAPAAPDLPREAALAELAQRYFQSRGPATLDDFATWSGLPKGEARAGLESIRADLLQETIDGVTYWLPPGSPAAADGLAYALPGFDEYLLGYKVRNAMLDPAHAQKVCPGGNGIFFPTIVYEGRIIGTWKRSTVKKESVITPSPFEGRLSAEAERAFAAALQPYAAFLGAPLRLVGEAV